METRRDFGWLWAAYAVSTFGTWLAFDALPLIAILVPHAGPGEVSLLAAAGMAAGALLALPLGPWVERRRKRRVMVAMDLLRCAAVLSVPAAYALGWLGFAQLLVVAVLVAAADIAFRAASGAFLKTLLPRQELLLANSRFESTQWSAIVAGPPLGGAMIGLLGPVATILADAGSYLLSALGLGRIRRREALPERAGGGVPHGAELLAGWRYILAHPTLRALFLNTLAVNGLIMATAPLMAVLMLGDLGFSPLEYGLAFGAPCVGGLLGARLSRRLVARFGTGRTLLAGGALRSCWSLGLAFVFPGAGGLALVFAVQFGLVASVGVFNPVFATYRLEQTPEDRVARVLAAWSIGNNASIAALTALWGLLAAATSARAAIAAAGALLLATPLLLPRRTEPSPEGVEAGAAECNDAFIAAPAAEGSGARG